MSASACANPSADPAGQRLAPPNYPPPIDVPPGSLIRLGKPQIRQRCVLNALPQHAGLLRKLAETRSPCRLELQAVGCHTTFAASPAVNVYHGPRRMVLGSLGVGETSTVLRLLGTSSVFGRVIPDCSHGRFTDFTLELYVVPNLSPGPVYECEVVEHA